MAGRLARGDPAHRRAACVDEIKTVCRIAVGGATERYGLEPDLIVMAKAMANGFPLAAVGGTATAMSGVRRTWISSTLATEWVALAASLATLRVMVIEQVPAHIWRVGALGYCRVSAVSPRAPRDRRRRRRYRRDVLSRVSRRGGLAALRARGGAARTALQAIGV